MSACRQVFNLFLIFLLSPLSHAEQQYPNIKGDLVFEDDRVIVQRFRLEPGQWEGLHTHPEHQLVIVLKDTEKVVSTFGDKEYFFTNDDAANSIPSAFWRPGPVSLEDKHNSGNLGSRTLEWIAITFKKDSIASERDIVNTEDLVPPAD